MSKRLDQQRQVELEPKRIEHAISELRRIGKQVIHVDDKKVKFIHEGATVTLYPYSGWFSGKTVNDGRGIKELFRQITKQ